MAALIQSVLTSGISAYMIIRDNAGLVWNGAAFEAYNSSNWSTYAIPLSEQSGSSYYKASFPSSISSGIYTFVVHTGSPATLGDPALDRGSIDWNGTSENYLGIVTAKLPSGSISGFDPNSQYVNLNSNQSGVTVGTVNALGTSAEESVKEQVDTSVGVDTIGELSGVPSSTPTLKQALMFLYMALRNKRTSTSAVASIYNSSGGVISSASQTDNGVTYSKENFS